MLHLVLNSIRGCPAMLPPFEELPFGCVVAIGNLVACTSTANVEENALKLKPPFQPYNGWEVERHFGNYGPDRWAWILRDIHAVVPYIPIRGYQKLWNWTPPVVT